MKICTLVVCLVVGWLSVVEAAEPKPPPAFRFTLRGPGPIAVEPGHAVTVTIKAGQSKGTAEPVTFNVERVPEGVTAVFSQPSCTPDCEVQLTLTTSAATPNGRHLVMIAASGSSVQRRTLFSLRVGTQQTKVPKKPKAEKPPPPKKEDPKPPKEEKPKPPKEEKPKPPKQDPEPKPEPPKPEPPKSEPPPPPPVSGSSDSGVSDAPTRPANSRMIVVAQDGSGQYRTIQQAADNSRPGDTIQVKNGRYGEYVTITTSGTRGQPITYMAYPGHRPVVGSGFRVSGRWLIIDGFDISGTHTGIHFTGISGPTAGNSTIRNNWIHDNGFMGIFASSSNDLLIENNTLERNGLGPGNCTEKLWGGLNYSHCHGIYTGNYTWCIPNHAGLTIRKNLFRGNSGSSWQNYTNSGCQQRSRGFLVENNVTIDQPTTFYIMHLNNGVIRNNTTIQRSYPTPQKDNIEHMGINSGTGNVIANNAFYTSVSPSSADLYIFQSWNANADRQHYRNNAWFVLSGSKFIWTGNVVDGFAHTYKTLTGDSGALVFVDGQGDKAFRNIRGGDARLTENSPLRGKGRDCPKEDKDGTPRSSCDIGAFAFK